LIEEIRRKIIEECLEKEEPFCTSACPFKLDIREFISRLKRGSYKTALRLYSNTVGFPAVVANLCHEPCRKVCSREAVDRHISLRLLEKAVLTHAPRYEPNSYNLPAKNKKVAVIGAGPAGLACALRLANKKYHVDILERSNRIGGHLWNLLEPEIFLSDIKLQFSKEQYNLYLEKPVESLETLLVHYDALYLATGAGGDSFGLMEGIDKDSGTPLASNLGGVFLGGSLLEVNTMEALSQGLKASLCIEDYLKTGLMRSAKKSNFTKMRMDTTVLAPLKPVLPADGKEYTQGEAHAEAARCIQCRCDACYRSCGMMHYFNKFPLRIAEEVEVTITPGTLDGDGTVATRLISTCNQCGLCAEVCPVNIDMGEFLRVSHQAMHEKGAMPWYFHDFWLRDMAFANSSRASFLGTPSGGDKCLDIFFPGCQLGASDPRLVTETFRFLRGQTPGIALKLGCCGVPAVWAGDMALFRQVRDQLLDDWNKLGQPRFILTCPSCMEVFRLYLPEIHTVLLYDIMVECGVPFKEKREGTVISVFDPCSSRNRPETQQAVRQMLRSTGYLLDPLPYEGKEAQCCSYGGQISIASPDFSNWLVKKRAAEGEAPYITYCSNCRDVFKMAGKPVWHILELFFGLQGEACGLPSLDERRTRREKLKTDLIKEYWPEMVEHNHALDRQRKKLIIDPALRDKMNNERLLEEDVLAVIEFCEKSRCRVWDPADGHYFGYREIGYMTQWVEYAPTSRGYILFNTYAHKMKVHIGEESCGKE